MNMRYLAAIAFVSLLSSCYTVPKPLKADVYRITPVQAVEIDRSGVPVRWGGRIVETRPMGSYTCFDMVGSELSIGGRPRSMTQDGSGFFIACRTGFYDPAIYLKNRELTFVGRIDGYENRKIGLTDSRFPRVAADVVYLWPQAPGLDPRYPYPRRPWPWAGWEWSDGKY